MPLEETEGEDEDSNTKEEESFSISAIHNLKQKQLNN